MNTYGHTQRDAQALVATFGETGPRDTQPRERSATCVCGAKTFNLSAMCDGHYQQPAKCLTANSLIGTPL